MSEVKILPNLVWKYNYEPGFDVQAFLDYQAKEAELHQTEADGGKSTAGHPNPPHEWECNRDFMMWLRPKIEICLHEWDVQYTDIIATGSWTNIHNINAHTLPHDHGSTNVVVSAYVQVPQDSGNLMFEQLLRTNWTHYSRIPENTIHDYWKEVNVNTNDVLLFPGWMTHKTQASKSNGDRITFTINCDGRDRNNIIL
tara:strand:+ start:8897 stop:9490 length:594 start_codon:yes stop_codon:yes gene_type:complete